MVGPEFKIGDRVRVVDVDNYSSWAPRNYGLIKLGEVYTVASVLNTGPRGYERNQRITLAEINSRTPRHPFFLNASFEHVNTPFVVHDVNDAWDRAMKGI